MTLSTLLQLHSHTPFKTEDARNFAALEKIRKILKPVPTDMENLFFLIMQTIFSSDAGYSLQLRSSLYPF